MNYFLSFVIYTVSFNFAMFFVGLHTRGLGFYFYLSLYVFGLLASFYVASFYVVDLVGVL